VQNFFGFYRFFRDSQKMKNDRKRGHIKGFSTVNPNRSYVSGVPGEIRTPDRRLRRPLLYPTELLGHKNCEIRKAGDGNRTHDFSLGS
jgi:hypothetical protein